MKEVKRGLIEVSKFADLMQNFIMANPKRAMQFLSRMTPGFWEKKGQKKAFQTFHEAVGKSSAYKDFIQNHNVCPDKIRTLEEFQTKVPITDKESYISKYKLDALCLTNLTSNYMFTPSSGSSGRTTFWPRLAENDKMIPRYFESMYRQIWDIDKYSSLVIIATALGYTAASICDMNLKRVAETGKYQLTIATPGADVQQVIEIMQSIGPSYEQIILIVYPSFLKRILDEGERQGLDWKKINLRFWIGGEKTEESWRKAISAKLGIEDNDLTTYSEVYGVSDTAGGGGGTIGFGSPLTELIRKLALENESLRRSLFDSIHLPSIVQYNPLSYFIEIIEDELVVTTRATVPLIRYNIHDRGGIKSFNEVISILEQHNYDVFSIFHEKGYSRNKIWKWPFIYVFGRSDETISIGGANIYPENIEAAMHTKKTEKINNFKLSVKTSDIGEMRFYILLELKKGTNPSMAMEKEYKDIILNKLLEVNNEFKDAYRIDQKSTEPIIKLYKFAEGAFKEAKHKHAYVHNGSI